jgi:cell division inhibitor SepF
VPAAREDRVDRFSPHAANGTQVLVFTPRSVQDARRVIQAVQARHTVLVNAAWLEDGPGQRLIDFVCGGIAALCGQVHRIAEEVFLFAPAAAVVRRDA